MGMMGIVDSFRKKIVGSLAWLVVKFDNGSGNMIEAEFFQPSGEDSPPLSGDTVGHITAQRQGGRLIFGVIDTNPDNKISEAGEVRKYCRDLDGTEVCSIYLKRDGSITLENSNGSLMLGVDGSVVCTGALVVGGDLTINGISVSHGGTNIGNDHTHGGVMSGGASTGGPQ